MAGELSTVLLDGRVKTEGGCTAFRIGHSKPTIQHSIMTVGNEREKIMIHKLSRVTTYIETFAIRRDTGQLKKRSHATGFFVRTQNKILLVTNWHVVTGLDPAETSKLGSFVPEVLKISVISKANILTELSVPLYDIDMKPRWDEHPDRHAVDLVVIPLPQQLESYFHFFDIESNTDDDKIEEVTAKDVFILGYPFSKDEMYSNFGEDNFYYFPIWKRGSIATEPKLKIAKKLILIDSLSRPGMSGSPVVIAEDTDVMITESAENAAAFKRLLDGDTSAFSDLNMEEVSNKKTKKFNLLGVYSGVIGTTKLQEVALGKCWHKSVLLETIFNHTPGHMPHHGPTSPHEHYQRFLEDCSGVIVRKNADGHEIDRIQISQE